jgi:hypothetical protein
MKYPQPTTILGCLRNTILIQRNIVKIQNGRRIPDITNAEAQRLTGTSMINGLDDNDDNFGNIERLSPLFIVKLKNSSIEDILFPVPADITRNEKILMRFDYEKTNNAISSYSGRKTDGAILSGREPKFHDTNYLGGKDFWIAYLANTILPYNEDYDESKVFKAHTSVGIGCESKKLGGGKSYFKKTTIKGMFYTKIDYSFHKGLSFAVIVWLKDENVLKNDMIILGGEQSAFHMEIRPVSDDISHPLLKAIINDNCDLFQNLTCTNKDKLIAISPLVFDEKVNSSLTGMMEHRIIKGIQAIRTIKKIGAVKSEAVGMIPASSVLYPKNSIPLTGWKIPYKIGYNYVIKIQRR